MSLTKKYQKKTDREHVLDNPDTYTGSMETTDYSTYIFNGDNIVHKNIEIIPGLYKLFDEGIVNCRDHYIRQKNNKDEDSKPVTKIEVDIVEDGQIVIMNDGNGIDVAKHDEYNVWIPEMIFTQFRTSTNYDKSEKKIVGGKNGFGVKLIFIWSTYAKIETIDHIRGLKYVQEFSDNLTVINKPKITKSRGKPYTKITFIPDYKRLGISGLTSDIISLFKRRVYDIAAVTNVKVRLNGDLLPIKTFQKYVQLYTDEKLVQEEHNRWEYIVCKSNTYKHVSFVNGIFTNKGGKHVDYIVNQICKKLIACIEKKKKVEVKPSVIKDHIQIFIKCDIVNPTFDSQIKDFLTTPQSKFGSKCIVSDKFIEKIAKLGIMDSILAITEVKESKKLAKTDGKKSKRISVDKLIDATLAGTAKSNQCTLMLVEGDSARASVVSGLSKEDRKTHGVFPLKGKLMNVRGETSKKIMSNTEICNIKKILGLESNRLYDKESVKKNLRYGRILILTDQDLDGVHIKGLCINLFDTLWQSLRDIPGFIGFMNTPIIKAKKGKKEISFYNDGDYEEWREDHQKGWNIKYFKGLGTSTAKDFKQYMKEKKVVTFEVEDTCNDIIDMAFNKKRSKDRKSWLENYKKDYLDANMEEISYSTFINKELIHFSKYDCERSIPNMLDGLKISQRKILFCAFKRNLTKEIKVAQFSGYVSEHSAYHHGEASLNGAIINMAQNYVGANNINLLQPNGQFGSRMVASGKDAASERYIFTQLDPITRYIFPQMDDNILNYLSDDGQSIEPEWYIPIIPMLLVNGSKGIGTGFSTDIPPYNPMDIINYIRDVLLKNEPNDIKMYYEGFKGKIKKDSKIKYKIIGNYEIEDNKVHITEIPIHTSIDSYKADLDKLIEKKKIKCYTDMCTDRIIDITVTLNEDANVEKLLKLSSMQSIANMHAFDRKGRLCKYETPEEIIDDFIVVRKKMYKKRKAYIIEKLTGELLVLSNRAKFILEHLDDTLDLRKKSNDKVIKILEDKMYDMHNDSYDYLIKMPMNSVTKENVAKLIKEKEAKEKELDKIKKTKLSKMWLNDLDNLENAYNEYLVRRYKD